MKNTAFLVFSLMVVTVLVSVHALIKTTLSPVVILEKKLAKAEHLRSEAEFKAILARDQLNEFQGQVATLIPHALEEAKGEREAYPLRQLASVIGAGSGENAIAIERASGLFEKAKRAFRDNRYEETTNLLSQLIEHYPASLHVAEAHFLMAEAQFRRKEMESSVATIEKMIDLYPENELTGFALLRLGSIFETQERLEDASEIYRAVLSNFKQDEIQKQAHASLKGVSL